MSVSLPADRRKYGLAHAVGAAGSSGYLRILGTCRAFLGEIFCVSEGKAVHLEMQPR